MGRWASPPLLQALHMQTSTSFSIRFGYFEYRCLSLNKTAGNYIANEQNKGESLRTFYSNCLHKHDKKGWEYQNTNKIDNKAKMQINRKKCFTDALGIMVTFDTTTSAK